MPQPPQQTLRIDQRQHQTLTPRLQQAVRLLQLSSLDFAQEVQQALDSNPFLEEDTDAPAAAAPAQDASQPDETTPWEPESWTTRAGGTTRSTADGDLSLVELMAAGVSLRDHLHGQLHVMPLSQRDQFLTALIVESLDDDGYLRMALAELLPLAEIEPAPELDELKVALKLVQSLEPAGVGARDLRECLRLQTSLIEDEQERELARRVLEQPLERLATRDVAQLSHALGVEASRLAPVCDRIRHLDPRPGWRFDVSRTEYVTPDVIVRRGKGGAWNVMLNPDVVPKVKLNRMYAELFQQHRAASHGELAAHLREARWTLRNVEQRFSTILDVADAIVRHQRHFFEYGPLAMKPMCLREIAEELGLHESTVCRVTNNKYMATPSGVFELKYFFSRALPTSDGGAASATAIRGLIRDLIEAEAPSNPLSDVQIARQLARQGFNVARRTVTKYRQMMKLPAVERRRRPA
jgi:RNA polymerase sigma-54 factor